MVKVLDKLGRKRSATADDTCKISAKRSSYLSKEYLSEIYSNGKKRRVNLHKEANQLGLSLFLYLIPYLFVHRLHEKRNETHSIGLVGLHILHNTLETVVDEFLRAYVKSRQMQTGHFV